MKKKNQARAVKRPHCPICGTRLPRDVRPQVEPFTYDAKGRPSSNPPAEGRAPGGVIPHRWRLCPEDSVYIPAPMDRILEGKYGLSSRHVSVLVGWARRLGIDVEDVLGGLVAERAKSMWALRRTGFPDGHRFAGAAGRMETRELFRRDVDGKIKGRIIEDP